MSETPMEIYGRRRPPSRLRYLWSVAILLIGVALFVFIIVNGIRSMDQGFTRFTVPGEQAIALEPASYTVFYEHRSVLNDRAYSTPQEFPPLELQVTHQQSGEKIPVTAAGGSASYQIGSREGRSVLAFTIPSAGTYVIGGEYASSEGPEIVLAVASGFGRGLVATILGGLAVCFGSIVLAVLLIVLVYRARERAMTATPRM